MPEKLMAGFPWFAHDEKGNEVTRERSCECGRKFTQRLLSERFLSMAENQGKRAIAAVTKTIPDYFVPVHCPSCECRDLGHQARLDNMRGADERHDGVRHAAD